VSVKIGLVSFAHVHSPAYAAVLRDLDAADFVGITVPNRFVFGYGMDVRGAWRNLPAVYAVAGT